MSLPIFKTEDKDFTLMQSNWASQLDPIIKLPISSGRIMKSIVLASGSNTLNHLLARRLQGWFPVRFHGSWAQIYDNQDTNSQQALTLVLVASAGVTVDLFVF